jgi:hypothetical protein
LNEEADTQNQRADYGEKIVHSLSAQLSAEYGRGYSVGARENGDEASGESRIGRRRVKGDAKKMKADGTRISRMPTDLDGLIRNYP